MGQAYATLVEKRNINSMNKKHLHHVWTKLRAVKPWYFLLLALIAGTICVASLRSNNQHMLVLRDAVYAADKNNGDVAGTLAKLQAYVTAHMNTDLSSGANSVYPPIQLKYTYDRLVQAESARVAAVNTQIYTDAQHYCEQQNPVDFSGHNRVPCITSYVSTHGAKAQTIPDSLYKFDFVSPWWSPDLAGWSSLVTLLSALLFVIVLIADKWFKVRVK